MCLRAELFSLCGISVSDARPGEGISHDDQQVMSLSPWHDRSRHQCRPSGGIKMKYKVEPIGAQFSNKDLPKLAERFGQQSIDGYRLHSVFQVAQPGCLGIGQG